MKNKSMIVLIIILAIILFVFVGLTIYKDPSILKHIAMPIVL